ASAAKNVAQSIYRYPELFARAMIDRVRKVDRGLASEADRVVSRTKELIGSVDNIVNHALRFAGSPMWTKRGRSIAALSRHTEKGRGKNGRWFTSLMTDAVASDRYYNQLDADQKQMVDHIRAVNRAAGRMAENAGVMRVTSTGEVVPFKVRDGQVFVRAGTVDLFDIIEHGPDTPAWKTLEEALIEMNPDISPEMTRRHLMEMYEQTGAKQSEGGHKKAAFEFFRFWPQF